MKKSKITGFLFTVIVTVLITLAIESFKNAGFLSTIFGPKEALGTIVSINSFNEDETFIGIDLNGDGKADITASTNSFLGSDILKQCSKWSDGQSDGFLTKIEPFTSVKVKVVKCTFLNGNFLQRVVPKYIVYRYGKDLEKKLAQK